MTDDSPDWETATRRCIATEMTDASDGIDDTCLKIVEFGLVLDQRLFYPWLLGVLMLLGGVATQRMLVVVMGVMCVVIYHALDGSVSS